MSTDILGISAFYHDSAACLVRDGEIIAAAQEERFTRVKGDASFPARAVDYCLAEGGITARELDFVGFYDKPLLKFERILETYLGVVPRGLRSFLMAGPLWIKEKLYMDRQLRRALEYDGRILYAEHHESHAASAFYPSPFDEAAILTMDGVGEWATASMGVGRGRDIEILKELHWPDSLGLLYSAFTYYTGFKVNSGEYKVMGLAPYGEPRFVQLILDELVDLREDGSFRLDQRYFNYLSGLTMTSRAFDELFGAPPRRPESPVTQREMDLARSVQDVCEEIMLRMARTAHRVTGSKNLCLAGGVALNCVGNGRILREGPFENLWIQPAAGDAGGALGVASLIWHRHCEGDRATPGGSDAVATVDGIAAESAAAGSSPAAGAGSSPSAAAGSSLNARAESNPARGAASASAGVGRDRMKGAYLGPSFGDEDIRTALDGFGAAYRRLERDELIGAAADALADERVLGWFNGRMEFGPRALGSRSILGDPRSPAMQRTMNLKIKYRESFRPFAPSVLAERIGDYFELDRESPYMLLVAPVREDRRIALTEEQRALFGIEKLNVPRSDVPAITHVNYSARVQSVNRADNPDYHDLIEAFEDRTGCGLVVNTSFNVRGEPIVCTPADAYTCFMRTDMDYLVVGPFLLAKEEQPEWEEEGDWRDEIELD